MPGLPAKLPVFIVIKRLGIDAKVEQAGLDHHGDMQVPASACDVAWFKSGPVPGAPGDAVIDGHLDWTSGPSVFWNLHQLRRGDEIDILQAGGTQIRFIVLRLRDVPQGTFKTGLFATTGAPTLSLYTCAGTWDYGAQTYSERLIVDATLAR
jgi:sortase (surface protein transpeptidase)